MQKVTQSPAPGLSLLRICGDTLSITLSAPAQVSGRAILRTNLGQATRQHSEIIAETDRNHPAMGRDWHDMTMRQAEDGVFAITLPLTEVGDFRAKAYLLTADSSSPLWPDGDDLRIKVAPAWTERSNTLYTAFVRQFGPHREAAYAEPYNDGIENLDNEGFTVIPPSGTFRDVIRQLDHIMDRMGFRILQLLPIHPTPTTYARMGRFGSPFASLDFLSVDPALAEFDRSTTPLDQFRELIDAVHTRDGRLFMDLPANHTGWASTLQTHHPEWFKRTQAEEFQSPGAWGVTWADLSELDYKHRQLWRYMADVFLFWCRQGVDGFRCDAGYMVPRPVWHYIAARVRQEFPETVFMLEGLGGPLKTTRALLESNNIDWAYSEIFQVTDRAHFEHYLPDAIRLSEECGPLICFAETHDNLRLAAQSEPYARMRTGLAALCSQQGAFGITNGVEWLAREKVDVHQASPLSWGAANNQTDFIARLNNILRSEPEFAAGAHVQLVHGDGSNAIALLRQAGDERVLVIVNLDADNPGWIQWPRDAFPAEGRCIDLLTEKPAAIQNFGKSLQLDLSPGAVHCLKMQRERETEAHAPAHQQYRALALQLRTSLGGYRDIDGLNVDEAARRLAASPLAFITDLTSPDRMPRITRWSWPQDCRRTVMIPPGHLLLVESADNFSAILCDGESVVSSAGALQADDGSWFVLLPPQHAPARTRPQELQMRAQSSEGTRRVDCPLLLLSRGDKARAQVRFTRDEVTQRDLYLLLTNGTGAMSQVRGCWGEIRSQYDALLSANLDPDVPVDRRTLLTRCRIWVRHYDYSCEVDHRYLESLDAAPDGSMALWRFRIPVGMGLWIPLQISARLIEGQNTLLLSINRPESLATGDALPPQAAIRLIIRPDIEDRANHEKTKAFVGPETHFPAATKPTERGFCFAPYDHALHVVTDCADFHPDPEWNYMVQHPVEKQRGLGDCSDLFSPGYFAAELCGGEAIKLQASTEPRSLEPDALETETEASLSVRDAAIAAIRPFVVKRDALKTVIAGYPWFLDWGRDTLICLRGMIAAGMHEESFDILREFGRFEADGTLPNMIRGHDDSNRDTSDAPLWFVVACRDLCRAVGEERVLQSGCGERKLSDIVIAIAEGYRRGTPNGIRMDAESGLVFSPSHFTWMDTNYPPGTPRQGYPIEIQALWYAALEFVAGITGSEDWSALQQQVGRSVTELFWHPELGYLSDCLHAQGPDTPAHDAIADDALRSNQIFAITLGTVQDSAIARAVLRASEALLVPGAIRSLADRPIEQPLFIDRDGVRLADPHAPYRGRYEGDEDTSRKPAYHNGTAWNWPFPSFAEALVRVYGDDARDTALALLGSAERMFNTGCVGQLPEILDGDAPHAQRGCGAQAWSATELIRAWEAIVAGCP